MTKTKVINKTNQKLRIRWIPNRDTITVEIYSDSNLTGYYSTTLLGPDNWTQIEA